jgi:hypothetical protein
VAVIESQTTVIESDSTVVESLAGAIDTRTTSIASQTTVIESDTTRMELGIITGAFATGTLAVGSCTTDLTGYANDQLIGRSLVVTSGDAEGEAVEITDYANASGLVTFGTDLTTPPADADTFKIV